MLFSPKLMFMIASSQPSQLISMDAFSPEGFPEPRITLPTPISALKFLDLRSSDEWNLVC